MPPDGLLYMDPALDGMETPNDKRRSAVTPPLYRKPSALNSRLQQQLLHPPVGGLGRIDLILRRAGELMRAGELLQVASRLADHAQHLALERDLEDPPRKGRLADEHHLVLARRDADRIGRADHASEPLAGRRVAIGGARRRIGRHVDG